MAPGSAYGAHSAALELARSFGEATPVHVFTSGDEAELFLNGKSMGRLRKQPFEYLLR